jgi:hypothetical protein
MSERSERIGWGGVWRGAERGRLRASVDEGRRRAERAEGFGGAVAVAESTSSCPANERSE